MSEGEPGTEDEPGPAWRVWALTLLPEAFPGPLALSLAGRALKAGIWRLETVDIRAFARDKHRTVDDAPFGGGPGMVMRADVLAAAIDATRAEAKAAGASEAPVLCLSPRGTPLTQARVGALAAGAGAIVVCGRFEGIDQRVLEARAVEEVSIGDFVLSGGEPAALCLIDAVVRLLPGVIGDPMALEEESFSRGLLEYPQYTRPQQWEGRVVPEALLSGHHERIRGWRLRQSEELTKARRRDLWDRYLAGPNRGPNNDVA
jgi:tRNA (guanine37-N1)-methyltransferase